MDDAAATDGAAQDATGPAKEGPAGPGRAAPAEDSIGKDAPEDAGPAPETAADPDGGPASGSESASGPESGSAPTEPPHLTLIGTGHVFKIDEAITDAIHALRPEAVFVELDRGRLEALLARRQGKTPVKARKGGFVQRKLQGFQERVASMYGAEAGGEMLAAAQAGSQAGAQIVLVDRPAEVTLKRTLSQLTWRERGRAVGLLLKGGVMSVLPRRKGQQASIEDEMRTYSEDPVAAMAEVGRQFPTVKRVVIDERDRLMAGRIQAAMQRYGSGVVVVGDGHVDGMLPLLEGLGTTVYRLTDVREGGLPKPEGKEATGTPESVSFGFTTEV